MSCPFGYDAAPKDGNQTFSVLGFETEGNGEMTNLKRDRSQCNYTDYIQTEALLKLQEGESIMKPKLTGMMHHEELLFIVTHQSIELWFKVLLKDLHKAKELLLDCVEKETRKREELGQGAWNDLALVGHYLRRATMIFHQASGSFAVLQTMHPADFLEFRDYLVPASGFQSFQFRQIEILLGVDEAKRATCNGAHVFDALIPEQKEVCETTISGNTSIRKVLENILLSVNVPETFLDVFYSATEELHVLRQKGPAKHTDEHAKAMGKQKMEEVKELLDCPLGLPAGDEMQKRESDCLKAALFVASYRAALPQFAVLSEMMDELVALEEGLLLFRSRHLHNVERVIGRRAGTGGSSGVGYLEKTREYRVFTTLWTLRQVFVRSSILPPFTHFYPDPTNVDLFKEAK